MTEFSEMDDEELIGEYRETPQTSRESDCGQVTPHEMQYRRGLETEMLERMD